jgi:hypothetical protein
MLRLPIGSIGGGQLVLTASLSHFLELGPELELLGSEHNADLTEGQLDALWAQTCQASDRGHSQTDGCNNSYQASIKN